MPKISKPLPQELRGISEKSVEEAAARIMEGFRVQTHLFTKDELEGLAMLNNLMSDTIKWVVAERRAKGDSWAQIGESLGISKQAAQQRFGKKADKPVVDENIALAG
ncbi:hypothetical protein FA951_04030 [Dermacoccus nishinomiyaensis]|uniref:Uncharacterized protein n=1 Tax=Dermacoccus nishinomiyaensis TaxID=1274 RepID=A0A075JKQ5_9MICO|nr:MULTISPECIES: hypothetical protein [Dermacoccus]AIF40668.1 hypothetical protein HX89_06620 [Dermacoccus nishinomiyaensis]MBO1759613.1 hypothetical protein [Dermacoccus sp. NHGro5]MCI0152864.1 hypothetical protein [Dermacoccus nishinomiyaensis]MCT1605335.1 hypothetical protein [Dermacoccus nishinomiyaensis]PZO98376.1 MAG: hypothetical protein DI618_11090 [Dermacoccus nishinomiyaensis]